MNSNLMCCFIACMFLYCTVSAHEIKCKKGWDEISRFCLQARKTETNYLRASDKCLGTVDGNKVGLLNALLLDDYELTTLQAKLENDYPKNNYFWVKNFFFR
jgi:hypothetical protein